MGVKPTRHYFRKAIAPPPKVRKVSHKGRSVRVTYADGRSRFMASGEAAMQMGRSKGGQVSRDKGVAHRFTPEEARTAAIKLWRTRFRLIKRTGGRIGFPAKQRVRVPRVPVRQQYALRPHGPIWCELGRGPEGTQQWLQYTPTGPLVISERTALRRLGYLPYSHKAPAPISAVLLPHIDGIRHARRPKWSVQLTFRPEKKR